jgi:glycosyltransferase involved in cell wall biosynthesis
MKLAISQASLTIAVSNSVAKGSQCLGAKDVQVHYFGAEVDTTLSASRKFNFLFVGRLVPLKQPLSLLKAVALLREVFRKEGASLQIVGSGPLEAEVRNFIEEQGLSSFVELVGYSNNLDSLYAESEYLISTSKFEGLPITFFEAKLHGLRVITFPSSGDFDILGVEDEVLKSFTEHELVAALKSAIQSGIASDNERHLVKERSQWMLAKHCADKYYELVENKLELSKLT